MSSEKLTQQQQDELLSILKTRFEQNSVRHKGIEWDSVEKKLKSHPSKLWILNEMDRTGGEPDVVDYDKKNNEYIFFDCSAQTPKGRTNLCYDKEAYESRKEYKPKGNAMDTAKEMGIEMLDEEDYVFLQNLGEFDTKTSSWLKTPAEVRKLGGAIFGDRRFDRVFVYHNGAESYYAVRGFRGKVGV